MVYLKRELLEGLEIDPDTLEVRIRIQGPGEQERSPGGGKRAGWPEAEWKEAFSLLCQAGERFVSYMGEARHQAAGVGGPAEASEGCLRWPRRARGTCRGT
jgi:hypothetical protein